MREIKRIATSSDVVEIMYNIVKYTYIFFKTLNDKIINLNTKGSLYMSTPLIGCENNYDIEQLYELYGTNEKELEKCLSCPNSKTIDGCVVTCKYFDEKEENDLK